MIRHGHIVLAGFCALAITGCAATTARQSMTPPEKPPEKRAPPTGGGSSQSAQQSGQGNVAGQIDAHGWTGVDYTTAVPVGQVILMGLMLLLSHRREMARIKQNGKHAT